MRTQSFPEMKRRCKFASLVLEAFKSFSNCTFSRTRNTSICRINLHSRPKIIYCNLLRKEINVLYDLYPLILTTVYSKEWASTSYFVVNFIAWLWKEIFLTSFSLTKYLLLHLFCLKIICIVLHGTITRSFTVRRWDNLRYLRKVCCMWKL